MEVDNNEWKIINQALDTWEKEGNLSSEQVSDLKRTVVLKKTGQQIAKYFFLIALSCTLMAFGAIFIDEKLLEKLRIFFSLGNWVIAIFMAALAAGWFYYIRKKASHIRNVAFEIYVVLGGLASITSLVYLCKDVGFGRSYTVFLALAAVLLGSISVFFSSIALWIGCLVALMGFYGAFSHVYSHDHLFLGMNYPVRFSLFGLLVLGLSFLQRPTPRLQFSSRITYVFSLIILFTGLWGVSIFGNFNDLEAWYAVRQTHVIIYGVVFGIAALISLYMGIRYKDDIARDLGILFLLVNFYSRYFEFFWDTLHKGLFFLFLAVSFWFIGRWIERRRKEARG